MSTKFASDHPIVFLRCFFRVYPCEPWIDLNKFRSLRLRIYQRHQKDQRLQEGLMGMVAEFRQRELV